MSISWHLNFKKGIGKWLEVHYITTSDATLPQKDPSSMPSGQSDCPLQILATSMQTDEPGHCHACDMQTAGIIVGTVTVAVE